jgi:hypothetical protein
MSPYGRLLTLALLSVLLPTADAQSAGPGQHWLVSPAEAITFQGEAGFNAPPPLRPRAAMPQIEILRPEPAPELKVKAPFPITVKFKPLPDAEIDASSFKVMYGALRFDITGRITKLIEVTKDGFALENAQIPTGKHRLILQVQDNLKRTAERELRVEVQ